jgi:aspartyl-tRNA(Asn)/glutamyl-tRNA(Gln) amidotransferase subunit C
MPSIDTDEVFRIAHLARLAIEPTEVARYARDLSAILTLVEQMQAVDTDQIEPMAHPLEEPQRLRADEVSESNRRELYQSIAPSVDSGLYLVPKVIE